MELIVIDDVVTTQHGDQLFGEVTSGMLTVSGWIGESEMRFGEQSSAHPDIFTYSFNSDMSRDAHLYLDSPDPTIILPRKFTVLLLHVYSPEQYATKSHCETAISALALEPAEAQPDTCRRIGYIENQYGGPVKYISTGFEELPTGEPHVRVNDDDSGNSEAKYADLDRFLQSVLPVTYRKIRII